MSLLLVEDNPADAFLVRTGFELVKSQHALDVVSDGVEAMRYLRRQEPFASAARPKLILLDLNMPRMDGRELLQALKQDQALCSIPVLVLTTTDSARDVDFCYRVGANSFVTKPTDIHQFFDLIQAIDAFWLRFSVSPDPDRL